tara:strand:- start:1009 stop:1230 length:222 start_codon:yes stop_codon:yes gene_type:complete
MEKFNFFIIMIFILSHCSFDNKSGLWENKNYTMDEINVSEINFDIELSFDDFKNNVVLYGKKSNYPNLIKNND